MIIIDFCALSLCTALYQPPSGAPLLPPTDHTFIVRRIFLSKSGCVNSNPSPQRANRMSSERVSTRNKDQRHSNVFRRRSISLIKKISCFSCCELEGRKNLYFHSCTWGNGECSSSDIGRSKYMGLLVKIERFIRGCGPTD